MKMIARRDLKNLMMGISLEKPLHWCMKLFDMEEVQAVYHFERPTYKFISKETREGNKTVLDAKPDPIWNPIAIEIPTRPLPKIQEWIDFSTLKDIEVMCIDTDGNVLEKWILKEVTIRNKRVARGRKINKVINLLVDYSWAQKRDNNAL